MLVLTLRWFGKYCSGRASSERRHSCCQRSQLLRLCFQLPVEQAGSAGWQRHRNCDSVQHAFAERPGVLGNKSADLENKPRLRNVKILGRRGFPRGLRGGESRRWRLLGMANFKWTMSSVVALVPLGRATLTH